MRFDIYIDQVITTYRTSIKVRIFFTLSLILIGSTIILLNVLNVLVFPEQLKSIINISGTLISSVCAFPIKEIVDKMNKIKLIKLLFAEFDHSVGSDKEKIQELLWKFIEKNTVD